MTDQLETLAANITGNVRSETLHGRRYLVAPVSMIVPGVLEGSEGAIYYPPDEVTANADAWNAMPLVGNHPYQDGKPVSARSPAILRDSQLGHVFNAAGDGKLGSEAWFDEVLTESFDRKLKPNDRILPRLRAGQPIEVSTGVFIGNKEQANEGAVYNGVDRSGRPYSRPYKLVARRLRPDHLAVLPSTTGACSVSDGCGVHVNEQQQAGLLQKFVDALKHSLSLIGVKTDTSQTAVTNAASGEKSFDEIKQAIRESLQAKMNPPTQASLCYVEDVYGDYFIYCMGDEFYRQSYSVADDGSVSLSGEPAKVEKVTSYEPTPNSQGDSTVSNTKLSPEQRQGIITDLLAANCSACDKTAGLPWKGKDAAALNQATDDSLTTWQAWKKSLAATAAVTVTGNAGNTGGGGTGTTPAPETITPPAHPTQPKKLTLSEWEASMPDEIKAIFNTVKEGNKILRDHLINQIIANAGGDDVAKNAARAVYETMSDAQLQAIAVTQTNVTGNQAPMPVYFGAAGGPVDNYAPKVDQSEAYDIPTLDYAALAAEARKQSA